VFELQGAMRTLFHLAFLATYEKFKIFDAQMRFIDAISLDGRGTIG
jgi:hypothetical protein